jgi:hypothetical protein
MDVTDALDSYLRAKVRVGEWEAEFMGRFYKPVAEMIINMAVKAAGNDQFFDQQMLDQNLSPEALQRLRGQ